MFGAIVYKLQATQDGILPVSHGRFVHAAVLQLLNTYNKDLAAFEHDSGAMNDFTVAPLNCSGLPVFKNGIVFKKQDMAQWRITALNKELLQALLSINLNSIIRVGSISFKVTDIVCDQERNAKTGAIAVTDFVTAIYQLPRMHILTLKFLEPTTFRVQDRDFPFPLPELIFGSLAKRWQICTNMELPLEQIKEQARGLLVPINWKGETRRAFLGNKGGVTGFTGTYTFDIHYLDDEMQKIFLLLAEFGVFAGAGRLTGQGLGQMSVAYK